ncbi:hypothetical protein RZS08_50450, partial [Arthrospira platensis SPKY1]|nr:hypothetical protein [Arthrospira platensis SPKY1]
EFDKQLNFLKIHFSKFGVHQLRYFLTDRESKKLNLTNLNVNNPIFLRLFNKQLDIEKLEVSGFDRNWF